jgi:hypothetical protein
MAKSIYSSGEGHFFLIYFNKTSQLYDAQALLLGSFTDGAVKQLKRYCRNTPDLFKKKSRQCSMHRGGLSPLLLSPNGVDAFFSEPNDFTLSSNV